MLPSKLRPERLRTALGTQETTLEQNRPEKVSDNLLSKLVVSNLKHLNQPINGTSFRV